MARPLGRGLPSLGRTPRRIGEPPRPPRGARLRVARTLNYARIRAEVMAAVGRLNGEQLRKIPLSGTLPEIMVALALVWLGVNFASQRPMDGGRLRLGGAVVDILVWLGGGKPIVVRVQGDYWHSLPGRKTKDVVQWMRLHARGYQVVDLWEHDIYRAWVEQRLTSFVEGALHAAA